MSSAERQAFAARLKIARKARRMTQDRLAADCNLSGSWVSDLEAARRLPSWENAVSLAASLGVSLDWLAGLTEKMKVSGGVVVTRTLFAQRLRQTRLDAGLSREKLAEMSGVALRCLVDYECSAMAPRLPSVIKIADALDVSIDYLTGRVDAHGYSKIPGVAVEPIAWNTRHGEGNVTILLTPYDAVSGISVDVSKGFEHQEDKRPFVSLSVGAYSDEKYFDTYEQAMGAAEKLVRVLQEVFG